MSVPGEEKTEEERREIVRQVRQILTKVVTTPTIPRNIRRQAREALRYLADTKQPLALRAANAIDALNIALEDQQIPVLARSLILEAIGLLDMLAKEEG